MKKFTVLLFTIIMVMITIIPIYASSYTYVADTEQLFDDSSDMIALCSEIRNKLDFNIRVISIPVLEDKEAIIEENLQDAQSLLIFVTQSEEMDYWAGSAVTKTIREVEFELLFHTYQIEDKQYTKTVNQLLSAIIEVYIHGKDLDEYVQKEELMIVDATQDSWFMMNMKYAINFVKTHPIRIIIMIIFLVGCVIYYSHYIQSHKE